MSELYDKLKTILDQLVTALPACRPVVVGGSVRDACALQFADNKNGDFLSYLSQIEHDFDVEIFRVYPAQVEQALGSLGISFKLVGQHFPVYVIDGHNIQFSFPRREFKTGTGHSDFRVAVDPNMSYMMAAKRRDFTLNTIGYDWLENHLMDPWHGLVALRKGMLEPTSGKFREDALRVLRAFRFIGSHGYHATQGLRSMCLFMLDELKTYPRERHLDEWTKFMLRCKAEHVDAAFNFLVESDIISVYPELKNLRGVVQDKDHHPEGDVFEHTKHCFKHFCKEVRSQLSDNNERLIVGFAVLTHDMGKAETTVIDVEKKKITSIGHEGSKLPRKFLERMFDPNDSRVSDIEQLVKAHMRPVNLYNQRDQITDTAIRRLKLRIDGRIDRLLSVVECDQNGRPGRAPNMEAIAWVRSKVKELGMNEYEPIKPIVRGKQLIEMGLTPGKHFGVLLETLFEWQLDGRFNSATEAHELLKSSGMLSSQMGGSS